MFPRFEELRAYSQTPNGNGRVLGRSREGREIVGYRCGSGPKKVSLIGGCHADEPVGPRFLSHLVAWLDQLPPGSDALSSFEWWIVPHVNPDGAERNRRWYDEVDAAFSVADYLRHVVRELPGDDIEFGFPRGDDDANARPENRALYNWWRSAGEPFVLHVSLHGMAFAGGPWFLIDPAWVDRCDHVLMRCQEATGALGYRLHDVERHGEKGFERIDRGFCTRPNSRAMTQFFLDRGDEATAARFRPSSMETMRALGGDPLTLVSEIPLFILPGVGEQIDPQDPVAELWRMRLDNLRGEMAGPQAQAAEWQLEHSALRPMPIEDQMRLQWTLIVAGIEQVMTEKNATEAR